MKRTVLSVLALSGALALGACGTQTATTGSTAAASASQPAGAQAKVGDKVALSELATRSAAAVEAEGTAHMTTKGTGSGTSEADIDFRGATPTMSMTMVESGETLQMVYVDKVIYLGGASMAEMSGGKKWVKVTAGGDDLMSQMMGPVLDSMESSMGNPAEQLKAYGDVGATVKSVENGVTTYAVTLTKAQLQKAVKEQAKGLGGLTQQALAKVPDAGITYELALDASSRPVGITMDLGDSTTEITYSKWGEPVTVQAPPASEVGTFQMPTG